MPMLQINEQTKTIIYRLTTAERIDVGFEFDRETNRKMTIQKSVQLTDSDILNRINTIQKENPGYKVCIDCYGRNIATGMQFFKKLLPWVDKTLDDCGFVLSFDKYQVNGIDKSDFVFTFQLKDKIDLNQVNIDNRFIRKQMNKLKNDPPTHLPGFEPK